MDRGTVKKGLERRDGRGVKRKNLRRGEESKGQIKEHEPTKRNEVKQRCKRKG